MASFLHVFQSLPFISTLPLIGKPVRDATIGAATTGVNTGIKIRETFVQEQTTREVNRGTIFGVIGISIVLILLLKE